MTTVTSVGVSSTRCGVRGRAASLWPWSVLVAVLGLFCVPTQAAPDLAVTGIRFTDDCRAVIQMANVGDEALPEGLYSSTSGSWIEREHEGAPTGDVIHGYIIRLSWIDPARSLRPPGSTMEWTDSSDYRAVQRVLYRWRVNPLVPLGENNYANNVREAAVPARCIPDLVVSELALDEGCHLLATVRNAGPGPLPSATFRYTPPFNVSKVRLQFLDVMNNRGVEGTSLRIDEARLLEQPGGSVKVVSTFKLENNTSGEFRAVVDSTSEIAEANEGNNSLTKVLSCGEKLPTQRVPLGPLPGVIISPSPLPDLIVGNLELDGNCKIFVTLRNQGRGSLPAAALGTNRSAVQFYKNNSPFGGSVLSAEQVPPLAPPGGSVRLNFFNKALDKGTTAEIRAVVDASNRVTEANEGNNSLTKILTCVLPSTMQPPAQPKSAIPPPKQLPAKPLLPKQPSPARPMPAPSTTPAAPMR